jgi:hypothetical protein
VSAFVINSYAFKAFSPTDVAGLEIWLDGNDANTLYDATSGGSLTASGGDVKRWEDKSGNGRHFTEATLAPSRVLSAINSKDAVRFESPSLATIERLTRTAGTFAQADFDNCFIVTQTSDTSYVWVGSSASNGNFIDATSSGSGAVASSLITIGTRRINGASVANTRGAYFTARGSSAALLSSLDMSGQAAGFSNLQFNYSWAGGFQVNDGYVCEMLVYSGTLSTTDRDAVESYLADKWGITI